jgi:hypothetical protein
MLNNGSNATISTSVVVMLVLASGLYFGKENISDFLSNTDKQDSSNNTESNTTQID